MPCGFPRFPWKAGPHTPFSALFSSLSGGEAGRLLLSPGLEGWVPVCFPRLSQKYLQEWAEAVAGGRGLGGGRWQQLLWAVLWGGGRRGCETGLGSCSQAKPPEWPLKQGLTLVSGKKPTLPAPEPSGEMGASPLLIPGGQCHGVKGPCAWSKCTPPRLLHTSVTLGRQPPPWTSVVTVQKLSKGQGQLGH